MQQRIPDVFVQSKILQYGDAGRAWCVRIPQILQELATEWDIVYDDPVPLTMNYVCRAHRRADGLEVIVKIGYPAAEFYHELAMYAHYRGRGGVQCLAIDHERCAVLLPALSPGTRLDEAGLSVPMQSAIILDLIERNAFPNDRQVAVDSIDTVIADVFPHARSVCVNRPDLLAMSHLDAAYDILMSMERSGWYPLHGDIHPGNVLCDGDSFVLIDPLGLIGPKVHEIVPFLFSLYAQYEPIVAALHARHHVHASAQRLALPVATVARWSYAMTVVSAWWSFQSTAAIPPSARVAVEDFAQFARKFTEER